MHVCHCQRSFGSQAGLMQHQTDKHGSTTPLNNANLQPTPPNPRANVRGRRSPREARMWRGLRSPVPAQIIDPAVLEPSAIPVSSTTPPELVCSYNWQGSAGFHVPGHAPVWQDLALPVTLPKDNRSTSARVPAWQISQYPFQQVFQAAEFMSPGFRFSDVDVVVTRNSLRKLLDLCARRSQQSFRVTVSVVHGTLFVEQYDSAFMAFQSAGWGHSFERAFTAFPPGLEASTSHDRFLRYAIGGLNCIVGFEVDACYRERNGNGSGDGATVDDALKTMRAGMYALALGNHLAPQAASPSGITAKERTMPQSTAAEIKSSGGKSRTGISAYLPQLWFGRTPWLIVGSHNEGTVTQIRITNVEDSFARWEADHQGELRRLAALLAELRDAVERHGGRGCAAIYDKDAGTRVVAVHPLAQGVAAIPVDVRGRFWD
ncbi:hypothetical protein B0T26DRAFT_837000 [Lasiosphaeria miniovina]|uniref:Uncharacterized protein n=1 Tax=Lasiosphaeria miniovina TaxID=1954250 RepID=A0AA40DK45_9PEZI|nr:uncharacterized protein B0T26DRAFT_837000 [Lasiosphaeria miniovina]KAK0706115.1 hypothetical protein B0T26DRAFT_837000 [Lasiosphaeria miniovina]